MLANLQVRSLPALGLVFQLFQLFPLGPLQPQTHTSFMRPIISLIVLPFSLKTALLWVTEPGGHKTTNCLPCSEEELPAAAPHPQGCEEICCGRALGLEMPTECASLRIHCCSLDMCYYWSPLEMGMGM